MSLLPSDTCIPNADTPQIWIQQRQQYPSRTHLCNDIDMENCGERIVLCGWTMLSRPMGNQLLFMPLRDGSGIAQLVFNDPELITQAQQLRQESVVCIEGTVRLRPQHNINPEIRTGKVEVLVDRVHLLNAAPERLPFFPLDKAVQQASDELRGRYRYLDLRRPEMQRNIRMRSAVSQTVRSVLNDEGNLITVPANHRCQTCAGFVEIETPLLFKSTPEGAREFLVPSRKSPGAFYALPQSPQQVLLCP